MKVQFMIGIGVPVWYDPSAPKNCSSEVQLAMVTLIRAPLQKPNNLCPFIFSNLKFSSLIPELP